MFVVFVVIFGIFIALRLVTQRQTVGVNWRFQLLNVY